MSMKQLRLFERSARVSGWAWKRYLCTGVVIIALVGLFARVDSQVSVQPTAFASWPTTSSQPGRLWFPATGDTWMLGQEKYNGATSISYFGLNMQQLTPPPTAGWTQVNFGTSSQTNAFGGISIVPQAEAGKVRILARALPGTPYTLTARFSCLWEAGTTGTVAGIGWRESGTDKAEVSWAITWASSTLDAQLLGELRALRFTGFTTLTGPTIGWQQNSPSGFAPEQAMRISDDGTNLRHWFSADGSNWLNVYSTTRAVAFTTAPDQVIFYMAQLDTGAINGTPASACTIKSWEVQ